MNKVKGYKWIKREMQRHMDRMQHLEDNMTFHEAYPEACSIWERVYKLASMLPEKHSGQKIFEVVRLRIVELEAIEHRYELEHEYWSAKGFH